MKIIQWLNVVSILISVDLFVIDLSQKMYLILLPFLGHVSREMDIKWEHVHYVGINPVLTRFNFV
jgi:hypothetical protein